MLRLGLDFASWSVGPTSISTGSVGSQHLLERLYRGATIQSGYEVEYDYPDGFPDLSTALKNVFLKVSPSKI